MLYFALAALASLICFLTLAGHFNYSIAESAELTLFFAFNAINLPWVALRYFSIAIDEYLSFEFLEASRRGLQYRGAAGLAARLPVLAFLLLINAGLVRG